ncbi:hypothetical protein Tco_0641807 [Tanacetum coccineum]
MYMEVSFKGKPRHSEIPTSKVQYTGRTRKKLGLLLLPVLVIPFSTSSSIVVPSSDGSLYIIVSSVAGMIEAAPSLVPLLLIRSSMDLHGSELI